MIHRDVRSNRDLYQFVAGLRERHARAPRSLEDYLKTLWRLCPDGAALSLARFAGVLEAALHEPVPAFDPAWLQRDHDRTEDTPRARWESTILAQVVDLHEMALAGTLEYEHRGGGMDAPRGARWYNFEPPGYLECAVAGTVGGWHAGDATGRIALPPGAMIDDDPTVVIDAFDWEAFDDFLFAGQTYE